MCRLNREVSEVRENEPGRYFGRCMRMISGQGRWRGLGIQEMREEGSKTSHVGPKKEGKSWERKDIISLLSC